MASERLLRNIFICLIIITLFTFAVSMRLMQSVIVPFVFAFLFYVACSPAVSWVEKKFKLPRSISVLIVVVCIGVVSVILMGFVSSSIGEFVKGADAYKEKVTLWAHSVEGRLQEFGDANSIDFAEQINKLQVFDTVKDLTKSLTNFMGNFFLVALFALFLLFGGSANPTKSEFLESLQVSISKYLVTKALTSLTTGLLVGIVLFIAGVDLAMLFAVLTVLLNFIPSFGSIIASLLPIPVLLLQFGLGWQFWLVISTSGLIQFAIGNVIEPKMMGDSLDLHPIAILLFLIFWGQIWGVAGMFLAVPLTAILKIVLSRIEETKPLANLLAGKIS